MSKKLYKNYDWFHFSEKIKKRDNYKCVKCERKAGEIVLQVHHTEYIDGLAPHQYPDELCLSVCSGCHAREHGILQPNRDWVLIYEDDLGELSGNCNRQKSNGSFCNQEIRYEQHAYHAKYGYEVFGSTCIDHLTEEDQTRSLDAIALHKQINAFLKKTEWENKLSNKGNSYFEAEIIRKGCIRIFTNRDGFTFHLDFTTKKGEYLAPSKYVNTKLKTFDHAITLAYITLVGMRADEDKQDFYRGQYRLYMEQFREQVKQKINIY